MNFPEDLYYSKEHTWLKVDGTTGTIGITEFAQSELGEIVYVELPYVGQTFKADEIFGSVEAVKTTSDLFIPVAGKIIAKERCIAKNPELVNSDPFEAAWMVKIEIGEVLEIDNLLTAPDYQNLVGV